jgi:hypothetical protein
MAESSIRGRGEYNKCMNTMEGVFFLTYNLEQWVPAWVETIIECNATV